MGSGDWNDGLDRVQGESVWLGWFLSCCLDGFAALLRTLGRDEAEHYEALAEKVGRAADSCHNGQWYLRAFFPDAAPYRNFEKGIKIAQCCLVAEVHCTTSQNPQPSGT